MAEIEIYTQDWCPYCVQAKTLLEKKGAVYREIDAPSGTKARAESQARSGKTSVPQIFIDGKLVGGCDDLVALERSGQLDALIAA